MYGSQIENHSEFARPDHLGSAPLKFICNKEVALWTMKTDIKEHCSRYKVMLLLGHKQRQHVPLQMKQIYTMTQEERKI